MSALTEQILADINARVEAAMLGTRTAGAHCAVSTGSVLREIKSEPKPVIEKDCQYRYGGHFRPCQWCGSTGKVKPAQS